MTRALRRERRREWFLNGGGWYFVLTVASAGIAAWVPFVHAALRLGWTQRLARTAAAFGAAAILVAVLVSVTPAGPDGQAAGGTLSTIAGCVALGVIAAGCLLQVPLRRQVFLGEQTGPAQPQVDPAVAAVLAARSRREEARDMVRRDPLLARELHIGRPDLNGNYDDGGLVDLGSAPAAVIASVCEIGEPAARSIVDMRDSSVGLHTVDDVFSLTDAPLAAWDRIRDRAVIIPA